MASPEILILLEQNPPLLTAVVFVFVLLVGSFLNVVVYRLPVMLERSWQQEARAILELDDEPTTDRFNLIVPASRCPGCGHQIRWYENIPVISWLALRGKCSECGSKISKRYPSIEICAALMSAAVAHWIGYEPALVPMLIASWVLLALALIDFDTMLLPDQLALPLLGAGLLAALLGLTNTTLNVADFGAVFGYLALWAVYWLFKLLTGKEGMGYGDFKLLAALGAWMGWQMLPLIILLSSMVGALVGVALIASRAIQRNQGIPFGPYLAAAGWIAMIWGELLVTHYLQLFKH